MLKIRALSLQAHKERAESWLCVAGSVVAEIDGEENILKIGDSVQFEKNIKHRLSSPKGGTILEVAFGICTEEDIERFEDKYGRA